MLQKGLRLKNWMCQRTKKLINSWCKFSVYLQISLLFNFTTFRCFSLDFLEKKQFNSKHNLKEQGFMIIICLKAGS
jgi:hypothetical protein